MTRYIRRYTPYMIATLGVLLLLSGVSLAESCTDADLPSYVARAVAGLALCGAAVVAKKVVNQNAID